MSDLKMVDIILRPLKKAKIKRGSKNSGEFIPHRVRRCKFIDNFCLIYMDITIIFKIVVVAIVVAIVNQLLQKAGKEEYTLIITIAGLIIALMMFLPAIMELKDELFAVMEF